MIELPPGGLGPKPRTGSPVPRVDLDLTVGERAALVPVVEKMRATLVDYPEGGYDCPCCTQLVTVYRRAISKDAAAILLLLYCSYETTKPFSLRHDGQVEWGVAAMPSDTWLLGPWGLLVPNTREEEVEGPDGVSHLVEVPISGEYFVSRYAERWLYDELEIPSHCRIYDGTVLNLDDSFGFTAPQSVSHQFDLDELRALPQEARKARLLSGMPVSRPRRPRT